MGVLGLRILFLHGQIIVPYLRHEELEADTFGVLGVLDTPVMPRYGNIWFGYPYGVCADTESLLYEDRIDWDTGKDLGTGAEGTERAAGVRLTRMPAYLVPSRISGSARIDPRVSSSLISFDRFV